MKQNFDDLSKNLDIPEEVPRHLSYCQPWLSLADEGKKKRKWEAQQRDHEWLSILLTDDEINIFMKRLTWLLYQ